MKFKITILAICIMILSGCSFRASINKNLITGLTTKGSGLSCDDVYLMLNNEKIERTTYIYGETVYINFNDIEGFKKENGFVFPGMQMIITNEEGKSVMKIDDLYAKKTEGINIFPLLLRAHLTIGNPMYSGKKYKLYMKIWDKKGEGTFTAEMPFEVKPNAKIKAEKTNASYDEIYLFSASRNRVIADKIGFNEDIYVIFDGISGFKEESGKIFAVMNMKITDSKKNIILNHDNLFKQYETTGIDVASFKKQAIAKFQFTKGSMNNPVNLQVSISDKKSNANLKMSSEFSVE